jgi:hypothetical protein
VLGARAHYRAISLMRLLLACPACLSALRVLWVSEAVKTFKDRYSPHLCSSHYSLFVKATTWSQHLADDYDEQIKGW